MVRALFAALAPALAAASPEYILTEEHHHIVPHLMRLAREGVIRPGATLLHLDSHHDGALPDELPHGSDPLSLEEDALLAYTSINNFLFALAWAGVVEHVVFVEPPWSVQCAALHNRTVSLRVGATADGAMRVSMRDDEDGSLGAPLPVTLRGFFTDDQVLRGDVRPDALSHASDVRFTVVATEDALTVLPRLLEGAGDAYDVVLDVDLDALGTTSPGALMLRDAIPVEAALQRIYRVAHNLCAFDADYWTAVSTNEKRPCVKEPRAHADEDDTAPVALGAFAERVATVVFNQGQRFLAENGRSTSAQVDARRLETIRRLLAPHERTIEEAFAQGDVEEHTAAWVTQPYQVDLTAVEPLAALWATVWRTLLAERPPKAVTLVRSPFYTPASLLPAIECAVSDALVEAFGRGGALHVSSKPPLSVDRVGCAARHPSDRVVFAEDWQHVERIELHEADVRDLFFRGASSEAEDADAEVRVGFLNEHDVTLELVWRDAVFATLERQSEEWITTFPHAQWTLRDPETGAAVADLTVQTANGFEQIFSSTRGHLPVMHHSPQTFTVRAPEDRACHVHYDSGAGLQFFTRIEAGSAEHIETFHGDRWVLTDLDEGQKADLIIDSAHDIHPELTLEL